MLRLVPEMGIPEMGWMGDVWAVPIWRGHSSPCGLGFPNPPQRRVPQVHVHFVDVNLGERANYTDADS